jgi:hypothetical protein
MAVKLRRGPHVVELPDMAAVQAAVADGQLLPDDEILMPGARDWRYVGELICVPGWRRPHAVVVAPVADPTAVAMPEQGRPIGAYSQPALAPVPARASSTPASAITSAPDHSERTPQVGPTDVDRSGPSTERRSGGWHPPRIMAGVAVGLVTVWSGFVSVVTWIAETEGYVHVAAPLLYTALVLGLLMTTVAVFAGRDWARSSGIQVSIAVAIVMTVSALRSGYHLFWLGVVVGAFAAALLYYAKGGTRGVVAPEQGSERGLRRVATVLTGAWMLAMLFMPQLPAGSTAGREAMAREMQAAFDQNAPGLVRVRVDGTTLWIESRTDTAEQIRGAAEQFQAAIKVHGRNARAWLVGFEKVSFTNGVATATIHAPEEAAGSEPRVVVTGGMSPGSPTATMMPAPAGAPACAELATLLAGCEADLNGWLQRWNWSWGRDWALGCVEGARVKLLVCDDAATQGQLATQMQWCRGVRGCVSQIVCLYATDLATAPEVGGDAESLHAAAICELLAGHFMECSAPSGTGSLSDTFHAACVRLVKADPQKAYECAASENCDALRRCPRELAQP